MPSRSALMGLGAVVLLGLAYGYGLGLYADSPYHDPGQGSPSMAAFGIMTLGILVGSVILTLVSILYVSHGTRLSGGSRAVGCAVVTILAATAAVVGYWLSGPL